MSTDGGSDGRTDGGEDPFPRKDFLGGVSFVTHSFFLRKVFHMFSTFFRFCKFLKFFCKFSKKSQRFSKNFGCVSDGFKRFYTLLEANRRPF